MWHGRLRHVEVAVEVGLQRLVELLCAQVFELNCVNLKGGIVHKYVQVAERVEHALDCRPAELSVRYVAGEEEALASLDTDRRVALLHYSPVEATLQGERLEIYPFLGSYLLAEAVDSSGADLVLHGHAHNGVEKGITPAGIPVRNVAQPVIKRAYNVYTIEQNEKRTDEDGVLQAV